MDVSHVVNSENPLFEPRIAECSEGTVGLHVVFRENARVAMMRQSCASDG